MMANAAADRGVDKESLSVAALKASASRPGPRLPRRDLT